MITDRTGQHEVMLPINHNFYNSMIYKALFKIKTQEIPRFFLLAMKKNKYCLIKTEIRAVDNQSDLRILL